MGQILGNLTNPTGVQLPSGQQQFYPSQGTATMSMAHQAANTAAPSTSDVNQDIEGNGTISTPNPKPEAQPQMVKPSFIQAATTGPGGTPNAMSPELTKAGKLVTLLTSGLKGALAGRAAQEQMIAQTGGRRAGGVGTGFQAGFAQPFQQAEMQQQAQQGQAATQLAQAGTQPVQTPYGQMPAALASKILAPYLGYQGKIGSAQIGAGAREQAATTEAGGRTQSADITGRYRLAALMAGTAPITAEDAQEYGLPQQFVGKIMKPSDVASLQRTQNQQTTTVQGENGPALVNKKTGSVRGLGLGNPGMGRPLQVGDPNNPGETTFTTGGKAVRSGASGTQSASVATAKAAAKSEVPSKIGDQKVAFNTAIQHADLLRNAIQALNNGDEQTLNGLKNRFSNEFGSTGPVTAKVIADAYGREVTSMLSKGHMTDSEIAQVGGTVDPLHQSPAQIIGVLNSYQALARSKMTQLNNQKNAAVSGAQPKRGASQAQAQTSANDPLGIR